MKKQFLLLKSIFQSKDKNRNTRTETTVVVCKKHGKEDVKKIHGKTSKTVRSRGDDDCMKKRTLGSSKNSRIRILPQKQSIFDADATEEIFAKMFADYHNKLHHSKGSLKNKIIKYDDASLTHSVSSQSHNSDTSDTSLDESDSMSCGSTVSSLSEPSLNVERKLKKTAMLFLEKLSCLNCIS